MAHVWGAHENSSLKIETVMLLNLKKFYFAEHFVEYLGHPVSLLYASR